MYDIDENLKTIYKNDMFPQTDNIKSKELELTFPDLTLTIGTELFATDKGDFELHESICMEEQLKFGKCNSSSVKFTLADVTDDIKGKEFGITQTVIDGESTYPMPLGYFTVNTAKKQDDLRFKDVAAYDRMKKIEADVTDWYNSLAFPTTLAAFRASFLAHIGLTEDTSKLPLPNDSMSVEKTIEPTQLSGRTVIESCEEINGCFGLMGRDGKFTHIILKPMHHDYPQNDYPESDYPEAEPYDEYVYHCQEIHFEEYRVQPINKIQIRQEENDVGAIYGTGSNVYIIQGNFLVYGKSAADLQTIAHNASVNIFDRGYRPYTATLPGLPYAMPGDFIKYDADDTTAGYVFERTFTGIQALQDEFSANGSEEQVQELGQNNEIIQLKGQSAKIEKSVDAVSVTVSALDTKLSGEIDVMAGQVVLKVDTNGNIGYIELNGDPNTDLTEITIKADNIELEGLVTVNGNFKVLADGSIEAIEGKFSGDITASTFIGGSLQSLNYVSGVSGMKIDLATGTIYVETGASFTSQGASYSTSINDGWINTEYIAMQAFNVRDGEVIADATGFYAANAHIDSLNSGTPITTYNKDDFTYPAAFHSHDDVYVSIYEYNNAVTAINDLSIRVNALEG